MNAVARALAHAAGALDDAGVSWALIGGLAVSCHVDPRFTRDIDIAVAVADDEYAELLVQRLVADGYRAYTAVEQGAVGRLATVRLATTTRGEDDVVVDLMFASSGIEFAICRDAVRLQALPGVSVPVATRGHLIATKCSPCQTSGCRMPSICVRC